MRKDFDCIIIGGGPGGLVSALYLARFNRRVLIVDKEDSRAKWIPRVRNLVAHYKGMTGRELLKALHQQVEDYKTKIVKGEAHLRRVRGGFDVEVNTKTYFAKYVVLATGMIDINPILSNLESLRKKQLLAYCPICDGYEHNHKRIGLIVRNNKGLRKLRFLRVFSKRLYVFKTKPFKVATQYIKEMNEDNIKIFEAPIAAMHETRPAGLLNIELKGSKKPISVEVVYVELGTDLDTSSTKFIKNLRRTKQGFIMTDAHQQTSIKGLYAVGDCASGLSQISVAVGHAATAATRIHNNLLGTLEHHELGGKNGR